MQSILCNFAYVCGPVGPGGGIYSITEDSLCQVYLLETFTHAGNVLFTLCLRWDIFNYRGCCVQSIFSEN